MLLQLNKNKKVTKAPTKIPRKIISLNLNVVTFIGRSKFISKNLPQTDS